jgi:hypothetical protein
MDMDGDGIVASLDCDDNNALINPGAMDFVGDGIDQNCDGVDGTDLDGDGFPSFQSGGTDCLDTDPTTLGADADGDGAAFCMDCDDLNPSIGPNAQELCVGLDNNCDAIIDLVGGVGLREYEQSTTAMADVLFIVDNSCSMSEEQAVLASNFPVLMDQLLGSGIDYHVGVITTDMVRDSGQLQEAAGYRWIDPYTVDPINVFANMSALGTGGSSNEVGRDAAYSAIELMDQPGMPNEGFTRKDAILAIIAISDENDHSSMITRAEFIDWMLVLKDSPDMVTFSSIVSLYNGCDIEIGFEYLLVTQAVGGVEHSICSTDWSPVLDNLGLAALSGRLSYVLPENAVPGSISATITGPTGVILEVAAADITYDWLTRTVTLPATVVVEPGSTILFHYALALDPGSPTTTVPGGTG